MKDLKNIQLKAEAHLEPKQGSMMEIFVANNLLFSQETSSKDGRLGF